MKEKKKYAVYAVIMGYNDSEGMISEKKYIYMGETYAVSAKQAENNVRFRTYGPSLSERVRNLDEHYDLYCTIRYEAKELCNEH